MKLKPLLPILLVVVIDLIGFGIFIPVLPFYAQKFGAGAFRLGVLFAAFSLMQFLFAPLLGKWSDRYGRRPILAISIFGTCLAFLLTAFAASYVWLLLARCLDGATGGNISTAYAYLGDVTDPKDRTAAFGLIGAAFGVGFVLGPALGGILSHFGLRTPFFFAAAMAFINGLMVLARVPEPQRHRVRERVSIAAFVRSDVGGQLRILLVSSFLLVFSASVYQTMFALFTQQRFKFGAEGNGWLFAYLGVLAVIIQGGLLRRLSPRVPGRQMLAAGTLAAVLGLAWIAFSDSLGALLGALLLLAIGMGFTTPVLSSMISEVAGEQSQGVAFGLNQSMGSLARFGAPLLGGWLFLYDISAPLWASLALAVLAYFVFVFGIPADLGSARPAPPAATAAS